MFRGRSIGSRSRSPSARLSPSRAREPSLARQATANSLSSFLSSQQPSSQPAQNDQPDPEDMLRDLIDATQSSSDAISAALHGVKRPHDDEATDEPLAKRDKLGEELERMSASHPTRVSNTAPFSSSEVSTLGTTTYSSTTTTNGAPPATSGIPTANRGGPAQLPIRTLRRRLPHRGNGTFMSRSGIPEASEPGSSSDGESERAFDGQGGQ
ncbi:hypothetical protein C8A00DRAFT_12552 [Chaetomidium leptoderma]|uniref:Uncharacterized protein n=1 Tax=Chaetomidium leptoderma TaxID=669021 RepID=A0AAN6VTD6_9PEZI|nr:hypothetical protein C8A00DRAFT_12552 [Chaetomidium leptoderma]